MSHWYENAIAPPCEKSRRAAGEHQHQLTKPPGSLGRLETVAKAFAGWQGCVRPQLERIAVRVFAGDHGISAQGVSAFPAEVTVQMIHNFIAGGAAISVLARHLQADFSVVNMGTFSPVPAAPELVDVSVRAGTADFSQQPAMTDAQLQRCLEAGRQQVDALDAQLFIGGEMGIANTTSAAAILAALENLTAEQVTGRGTGVDDAGLAHKTRVVAQALDLHRPQWANWRGVLQSVGGLEIAALCGAYIRCAQRGIPVLVDGFIATVAALAACYANEGVRPWLLASHRSAESGHLLALQALNKEPLLDLGMRLGEGSGAAVTVPLLQNALRLHCEMATFADAGVESGA